MNSLQEPLLGRNGTASGRAKRKSFMDRPASWVAITLVAASLAYVATRPYSCSEQEACEDVDREVSRLHHAFATTGLVTVFIHELACWMLTRKSIRQAQGVLGDMTRFIEPSAFLCWSFFVLILENVILLVAQSPWYAHSTELFGTQQPVYTVFYVEWLINVPILLILAGKCALQRPLEEVARPLVITNLYIILAWCCYHVADQTLRNILVSLSFAMYAYASYDMMNWVVQFLRCHPDSSSGLYLRPVLTMCLIVIFGIYGLVFLGRLAGSVTSRTEKLYYTYMDIGSKLLVSMIFSGVRSSQYNSMLLDMLANTNTSFRRTFNHASSGNLVDLVQDSD